jgi:anti-sigma factor RsiW
MTEPPTTIPCRQLVELVTDYFEGTLPGDARIAFERHLALCDGCTAYVEQMRLTLRVAERVTPAPVDPRVERALLDAFRARSTEEEGGP